MEKLPAPISEKNAASAIVILVAGLTALVMITWSWYMK